MLKTLRIKNYAIIRALEVDFAPGLNIITGETGAGKSIILGALGLILGNRADTKALMHPEEKCVIEGIFTNVVQVQDLLASMDLDHGAEIILRRELNPIGKSRAFINDTPVSLTQLREVCGHLVDMHQQFETIGLQKRAFQTDVLDTFCGCADLTASYRQNYNKYITVQKKRAEAKENTAKALLERDYLKFQLDEFVEINLEPGGLTEMEQQFHLLSKAEQIQEVLKRGSYLLMEADSAMSMQLNQLAQNMRELADVNEDIAKFANRLEALSIETDELAREFGVMAEQSERDDQKMQELEERLNTIRKLQIKHNTQTEEALFEARDSIQRKLDAMKHLSDTTEDLEREIETLKGSLEKQAGQISVKRKAKSKPLESEVAHLLEQLNMEHARLQVELTDQDALGTDGREQVSFLFSPNKGSTFLPIKNVASGGELARLNLCIKSVIARKMALPSLIFDEIDSGISGEVALKMGGILLELAHHHQIIVITHTPQIASRADKHFRVSKHSNEKSTVTQLDILNGDERIIEIAKMLSGDPPSEAAIDNAKELINYN